MLMDAALRYAAGGTVGGREEGCEEKEREVREEREGGEGCRGRRERRKMKYKWK